MKIYDISQAVFGCEVYQGDKPPTKREDKSIANGDLYNLTYFEMCAHNGTHIDAPLHFLDGGDTVEQIPLEKTVGNCYVVEQNEDITASIAKNILARAREYGGDFQRRILIKGKGVMLEDGARIFAQSGVFLVGVESQSVGSEQSPIPVHKILLGEKAVLLEGIRLGDIAQGCYFLVAAPLNLNECEGAPCRAILIAR